MCTSASNSPSNGLAHEGTLLAFHFHAVFLLNCNQRVNLLVIVLKHLSEVSVILHMLLH